MAIGAAVSLAATQEATRGGVEGERERALVKLADETVGQLPEAERPLQALQGMRSMRCFLRGQWKDAIEAHEMAYGTQPTSRGGWNAHAVAVYGEFALGFLGEAAELGRRLPALLTDAERRGDRLKVVNLRTGVAPLVHLAQDDPDGARRQLVRAVTGWAQRGFLIQHWRAMIAEVDIYLYERKGALARERLARHERAYRRSMLGFAQYVRAITRFARARCAIACAQDAGVDGRRALREASQLGRRLERERTPWIGVLSSLIAAAVANAEGRLEEACERLREAAQRARAAHMALHEAAAEHRLGILLGDEGRERVRKAQEAMRAKGVDSPDRYAAMLLPGCWGERGGREC